jgi:hypothetical protein
MAAFSADLLLSRLLARPLKMPVLATQAALLARPLESGTLLGNSAETLLGNSAETLLSNAAVTLLGNAAETLLGNAAETLLSNAAVTLLGNSAETLLGNAAETLLGNSAETLLGNSAETLLSGPLDWSGRKDLAGRDDKQTQYRHNRYISHVHLLVRRLKVAGTCPNTCRFLFYSTVQVCPASRF